MEDEKKRIYWMKLKDDFFASKRIKKLRRMAGGDTYLIIYLKMQLKAIKNGGVLNFAGIEDDLPSEIALDIDETPENVAATMCYLIGCGLAETSDDARFVRFPYAIENTKSETPAAEKMRRLRQRRADESNKLSENPNRKIGENTENVTMLPQCCNIVTERENKKQDIYIDSLSKRVPEKVLSITDEQFTKLSQLIPQKQLDHYIEVVERCEADGMKYSRSHYEAIMNMFEADKKRDPPQPRKPDKPRYGNFDPEAAFEAALARTYEGEKENEN